jgi:DnaK suppressor protein
MAETLTKTFTPYQAKPDEEYMNKNQLKHFRGILNDW